MSRAADNDNKPTRFVPLDGLPLFATDRELAVAIVGRARADNWIRGVLPTLKNFPPIDSRHGGRPVALVAKFYDSYLGVSADFQSRGASGEEDLSVWTRKRKAT